MVVVLFLVCVVAGLAAAGANQVTAPIIAEQEAQALSDGLAQVLPEATAFEAVPADQLAGAGEPVEAAWRGRNDAGQAVGVVVQAAPGGYGGPIRMLVGVAHDGTLHEMKILSAAGETPGLGSKAARPDFLQQFAGLKAGIGLVKGQSPAGNEIQAITGATISSTAVTDGVNQALEAANKLQEGR